MDKVADDVMRVLMVAQSNHVIRLASAVAFAILYFDYTVTFDAEVERFWKGRFTLASLVFYLNRYLSLFGHIPVIYEFYWAHDQSVCSTLQMYHQMLAGITQVVIGGLQLFRIHALYSGNRSITFSLFALCVAGCVISGWSIAQAWKHPSDHLKPSRNVPGIECDFVISATQGNYLAVVWGAILAFDAAVFALTIHRISRIGPTWRGSLFMILLRDGSFYFAVLSLCHFSNILTCLFAQPAYRGMSVTITNVIASSLITRLMLNIRDPDLLQDRYRWSSNISQFEWRSHATRLPDDPA